MFMVSQKFMVSRLEDQTYPSRQSSFWLEAIENEMRIAWKDEVKLESRHWCQVDLRCGGTQ